MGRTDGKEGRTTTKEVTTIILEGKKVPTNNYFFSGQSSTISNHLKDHFFTSTVQGQTIHYKGLQSSFTFAFEIKNTGKSYYLVHVISPCVFKVKRRQKILR
jgi:hypothetical protein